MRVSTSTLFSTNVSQLNTLQSNLIHTQQQISTGRRILTPSDDPVGIASVLQVSQSESINSQYIKNIGTTKDAVTISSGTLQDVTTLIGNIQTSTVSAGNAILANSDRKSIAVSLQANLNQLIAMANSTDAVGNYLFSGFKGNTQPFVSSPNGVQYNGDDGQRQIQVSGNRQLAASDSGANIFMRIKNGNGVFSTQMDPASNGGTGNTGSGVISTGSLAVPPPTTAQLGNTYSINFTVTGGVTTYSVTGTDLTGAALPTTNQPDALPTNMAFTSGQPISFNGVQFDIQGAPANGDQFTVKPSTNESVFTTISNLINTLNTPLTPGDLASQAKLSAGINTAMDGLNNALNNVLVAQASMGSRLNELDALNSTGTSLDLQFKQTISNLQDLDYNKALTDLTQQKTILSAAQQSFVQIENLSMFNYMR